MSKTELVFRTETSAPTLGGELDAALGHVVRALRWTAPPDMIAAQLEALAAKLREEAVADAEEAARAGAPY
jgi:hypothetical protein